MLGILTNHLRRIYKILKTLDRQLQHLPFTHAHWTSTSSSGCMPKGSASCPEAYAPKASVGLGADIFLLFTFDVELVIQRCSIYMLRVACHNAVILFVDATYYIFHRMRCATSLFCLVVFFIPRCVMTKLNQIEIQ